MPNLDPAEELAGQLEADLGPPWEVGKNIFFGGIRPASGSVPSQAIFVIPTGGGRPQKTAGNTITVYIRVATLDVIVRGPKDDMDTSRSLAKSIYSTLRRMEIAGTMSVDCTSSDPLSLGQDDQTHWLNSIPAEVTFTDGSSS